MPTFKSEEPENRVLFTCRCVGGGFRGCETVVELTEERDCTPPMYWLNVYATPPSLWQTLRWWWTQRKAWYAELYVDKRDLKELGAVIQSITKS